MTQTLSDRLKPSVCNSNSVPAVGVLLLAIFPALLRAQSASEKPGPEFSCLVWDALPIAAVFYRDGKSFLPLEPLPLKEATALEL